LLHTTIFLGTEVANGERMHGKITDSTSEDRNSQGV
jgi:hypothetical protein